MKRTRPRRISSIADEVRRGDIKGTPAFEAEVDRDVELTKELMLSVRESVLLPFLSAHPDVGAEVVALALLRVAAIHIMSAWEMGPIDFSELARCVADEAEVEAKRIRAKAQQMGQA